MKITRTAIFIIANALALTFTYAQSIDKKRIARETLECSIAGIDEYLPQDFGNMIMDKVSVSDSSFDYYYTIKDNAEFLEYRKNKSIVKENLYITLNQGMSSIEWTLLFCIDANISLNYHFRNKIGSEVVITFSVSELMDLLGKAILTTSYRQEVVRRMLPTAFSAAGGTPMSYQGMTDNNIMYTLLLDDNQWDDDAVVDQSFMVSIVRSAFDNDEAGRIFPLLCIYSEKGEDLTLVNSKTGARKNGILSYDVLCNIYNSYHNTCASSLTESLPPFSSEPNCGEKTTSIQAIDVKPLFNGEDANLFSSWVNAHLEYPKEAIDNGKMGSVFIQFTIDVDGTVTNVSVLRGVDPLLDAEAVRVVKSSPKWTPGMNKGQKVRVTYTFPVVFSLN